MDYRSVQIDPSANIAPDCSILGHVTIGPDVTVFSGAALRGDYGNDIVVGARSNIQENCVFHVNAGTAAVQVGEGVTVGHGAIVHGCRIGDNTLIGMGAIIMDDARVGSNCLIAAGAVVTQGTEIPDGSLAMGCPARVKRQLTEEEINTLKKDADDYVAVGRDMVENGVMLAGDAIPADHPTIGIPRA